MLFNSYTFMLVFVPVVVAGFTILTARKRTRWAMAWLTLASFAFYTYWDYRYVPLLIGSIAFNYIVGRAITLSEEGSRGRRALLVAGLVGDLALLGFFKYAGFFVETADAISGAGLTVPEIILPLGISFFTFTQIEYLVDAFRGEAEVYPPLEYALFVTFYPHLIAGPILRHSDVIPQFRDEKVARWVDRSFAAGFAFFAFGLFKKTAVADSLSSWVAAAFANPHQLTFVDSWAGALAYTFQLYFDFSGYSDMAVGLGLMLNITLPINFDSPYKSRSIIEFWRRWHITLSHFLRDYLYFPLGGSRCSSLRRTFNLMVTMLLGGLWHGAGWTFVIWGGWHGLMLSVNHAWNRSRFSMPGWLAWAVTFGATVAGWVVFRAGSVADALDYLGAMFGANGVALPERYAGVLGVDVGGLVGLSAASYEIKLAGLIALVVAVVVLPNTQQIVERLKPNPRWLVLVGVVFCAGFLMSGGVTEFLYFQF